MGEDMTSRPRKILFILMLTVLSAPLPLLAQDLPVQQIRDRMKQMLQTHPELKEQMMQNPDAILAMAYRNNMLAFGQALDALARKSETVPQPYARIAAEEMKRSVEQLDKYHSAFHRTMPDQVKNQLGDLPKQMDEHLAKVKKQVNDLNELAKQDRVSSKDIISQLETINEGCQQMGMHGTGMHGDMHGMQGMHGNKHGDHGAMGRQMSDQVKAEDAALLKQVEELNKAPVDKRLNILTEIVTKLVQQRAAANSRFDRIHGEMMHQMPGYDHGEMQMDNDEDEMDMDEMDMDEE